MIEESNSIYEKKYTQVTTSNNDFSLLETIKKNNLIIKQWKKNVKLSFEQEHLTKDYSETYDRNIIKTGPEAVWEKHLYFYNVWQIKSNYNNVICYYN